MTTTQRRQVVTHLHSAFAFSLRHACRLVGLARSRWHATLQRPVLDAPVRARLRELAAARPRFGYERLHLLLQREGLRINHKRVLRLYREERLAVRVRRRQKHAVARVPLPPVTVPNERWGMDFIHDRCADRTMLRCLTMVDECTRECPVIEVGRSLPAARVIETLETLAVPRGGYPRSLVVDHGPEFVSRALDLWAYRHGVTLWFIRPGKPTENAYVESFHARFRDECLGTHWFESVLDARFQIEQWRRDYDEARPHTGLGGLTPNEKIQQLQQEHEHPQEPLTRLSA